MSGRTSTFTVQVRPSADGKFVVASFVDELGHQCELARLHASAAKIPEVWEAWGKFVVDMSRRYAEKATGGVAVSLVTRGAEEDN